MLLANPVHPPSNFSKVTVNMAGPLVVDPDTTRPFILPEHYKRQAQILWPRTEIVYTDGSARDTGKPDYYRSGTGVFRFESAIGGRVELRIDPIDYHIGVANTIQRAELVGIYRALQLRHNGLNLMICTDSLTSMYMIDKHMRCPSLHKECKHEELLTLIVEELASKARNGIRVQLLKVKSHIGVEGNEQADRLANDACIPSRCNDTVAEGVEIRQELYWPYISGWKIPNRRGGAAAIVTDPARGGQATSQADPTRQMTSGKFQVNDLRRGLKAIAKAKCAQGFSNKTIYVLAWLDTAKTLMGDVSNHFWNAPDVTTSMITMILKYRFGQLWNMKIAFRQQRPYLPGLQKPKSDRCPHCGSADSGGHILGGCKLPIFKALYISRHDSALRMLLKAIVKGSHGGFYTIADIGREELIKDLGVNDKRIASWLLPDSALIRAGIEARDRHRVRPDIMFVEMSHPERTRYHPNATSFPELSSTVPRETELNTRGPTGPRPRKVWVLDGGYTSDTRHLEKIQDKETQHSKLMHALQMRGYDAKLMIFTFGVGDSIYQQAHKDMQELGATATTAKATLRAIHLHSIESAATIITQRRILDRQKLLNAPGRPP